MRLTLQQIEDVFLHSEKERLILPVTWSLLYFAARNDGIEALDALQIIRREPYETGILVENFLGPGDLEEVKKLSFMIGLEMPTPHCAQAISKRMLDAWIAKTLMIKFIPPLDRRRSLFDDS